jgi:uncharacterized protein (DUF1800 family)
MLTPLASSRWDFDAAAHLLVRAGIGGTPGEIEKTLAFGPEKAVNTLVNAKPDNFQPPSWAATDDEQDLHEQLKDAATPDEQQTIRKILQQKFQSEMKDLMRWWVSRMLNSSSPLVEKMTLFWHGHFATSAEKVRPAYKMWLQNETFRREGLGNFCSLIKAVSRDPAMMVWLDTAQSRKERPNENFAREVMELFTLGEGHYTEADVKAAARAFTGYRIDQLDQSFRFAQNQFDPGLKTFMGKTGPWNGDQILDIILSQLQCARFIVSKIWRFFAYEDPEPNLVDALASELRNGHYELRPFMGTLFLSEEFYSAKARKSQIKSPIQLILQALHTLSIPLPDSDFLDFAFRQLGQIPFYPPNVKGWDGGKSWINTATLIFRYKLAHQLVDGIDPREIGFPRPPAMEMTAVRPVLTPPMSVSDLVAQEDRSQPDRLVRKIAIRTFQSTHQEELIAKFRNFAATRPAPLDDNTIRELLLLMMTTPEYQIT